MASSGRMKEAVHSASIGSVQAVVIIRSMLFVIVRLRIHKSSANPGRQASMLLSILNELLPLLSLLLPPIEMHQSSNAALLIHITLVRMVRLALGPRLRHVLLHQACMLSTLALAMLLASDIQPLIVLELTYGSIEESRGVIISPHCLVSSGMVIPKPRIPNGLWSSWCPSPLALEVAC